MSNPIIKSKEELALSADFVVKSLLDEQRLDAAWHLCEIRYRGDGWYGAALEILRAGSGSRKTRVASPNKDDNRAKFRKPNGKIEYVKCESKHSGGRIESLRTATAMGGKWHGKYVIYDLFVCNSTTCYKPRAVPAVIIPIDLFLRKLEEFNAIKDVKHNGVKVGTAIQCSNKSLYEWLLDWPIPYDRNAVYTVEDFEGLE